MRLGGDWPVPERLGDGAPGRTDLGCRFEALGSGLRGAQSGGRPPRPDGSRAALDTATSGKESREFQAAGLHGLDALVDDGVVVFESDSTVV